jgi:hypothetical protein
MDTTLSGQPTPMVQSTPLTTTSGGTTTETIAHSTLTEYQRADPPPVAMSWPSGFEDLASQRNRLQPTRVNAGAYTKFRKTHSIRESRTDKGIPANKIARVVCRVGPVLNAPKPPTTTCTAMSLSIGSLTNVLQEPPKHLVGFLCCVPAPVKLTDVIGQDRHPVILAELYARAFPSLQHAWRRMRLLIGVNLRDDFRLTADSTAEAAKFLLDYVTAINAELVNRNLPALAIPLLWGYKTIGSGAAKDDPGIYVKKEDEEAYKAQLSTTTLRTALAKCEAGAVEPKAPAFPFASMRAALVASPEAAALIASLETTNEKVFFHTGDADLVTMASSPRSTVLQSFAIQLESLYDTASLDGLARCGGAFTFAPREVLTHTRAHLTATDSATEILVGRSLLLTMLAKTLDTAVRGVLYEFDGMSYYAEPNTFLNTALRGTLSGFTNERTSMPDWASLITGWLAGHDEYTQDFIPGMAGQLITSSRHALVIVSSVVHPHVVNVHPAFSALEVLTAFANEHNTQITDTQLNERWKESKWKRGGGKLKQELPRADEMGFAEPTLLTPFLVLRTLWGSDKNELFIEALRKAAGPADDIKPYFIAEGLLGKNGENTATAATLLAEMERVSQEPERILGGSLLAFDLSLQLAQCEAYSADEGVAKLLDVLLEIEVILRWALQMIDLILALQ